MLPLEGEIERKLGLPVQIVILNDAPEDLVHRVLRDGRVLLDRDRSARLRFEVKARNEYFDMQPIRARYRRAGVRAEKAL
jgi:predicted nucleotidyltransferase